MRIATLCSQLGRDDSVFDSCLSYWGLVIHFCYTYLSSLIFRSKCVLGKPIQDMSVQESCDQSEVLKLTSSRWRQEMTSATLNPFHWRCLPSVSTKMTSKTYGFFSLLSFANSISIVTCPAAFYWIWFEFDWFLCRAMTCFCLEDRTKAHILEVTLQHFLWKTNHIDFPTLSSSSFCNLATYL
jgi:hypothetical protein